jgi:acyl-CoA synthetase (NDP forming)
MPLRLLRENGYAGAIYPVHRDATEIQGLRAYASLLAIDQPVDLAIVAVPAAGCEAAMDQMLASGTRAAVIFSSGFAETGAAGAAAQARMGARAREAGMLLLGPNCLGAMNMREKVFATFSPVALGGAEAGALALVSQSGAFGGYAFSMARDAGLGLGYWITTGNEAGVQVADAIHWLAQDTATRVILVYIEGCRDEPRLVTALAAARSAGKPVVVVKVGHTPAGARAARLHTGSEAIPEMRLAGIRCC